MFRFASWERRGSFTHMKDPHIEQRGEFAPVPRKRWPAPTLPGIEATILQSLARGREAVVSRSMVAKALNAETDDIAVTGWADRLARQHRVHWTCPSFQEILFALDVRE